MKKIILASTMITITSAFIPFYGYAEEILNVNSNVSMVSKYMFRGENYNDHASIQGGFNLTYDGLYTSLWGATDEEDGTEVDLYLGYGFVLTEQVSFDMGVVQYKNENYNSVEWHIAANFNYFTASFHKGEDNNNYYELNTNYVLTDAISTDIHIGLIDDNEGELTDVQVTLNYDFNDNYTLFLALADKKSRNSELFFGIAANF